MPQDIVRAYYTHTAHSNGCLFSTCMPAFPSVIRSTKEDSDARSASTPMLSSSSHQESFFPRAALTAHSGRRPPGILYIRDFSLPYWLV